MSSPFKTPQEFLEVKGPLYTFANSSFWLTLFLVFTVIIFLWFIFASYKIKASEPSKSDPAVMSVLILTGFISLAQSAYISGTTAITKPIGKINLAYLCSKIVLLLEK